MDKESFKSITDKIILQCKEAEYLLGQFPKEDREKIERFFQLKNMLSVIYEDAMSFDELGE